VVYEQVGLIIEKMKQIHYIMRSKSYIMSILGYYLKKIK